MHTTQNIRRRLTKEGLLHRFMLVLSFSLLVVTCPVKKWLDADSAVPSAARTHETGIRSGTSYAQRESVACAIVEKMDRPTTSITAAPQKKPVAFLHYDIGTASGSALSYFLSGLPTGYGHSIACVFYPLPLYLQFRSILV